MRLVKELGVNNKVVLILIVMEISTWAVEVLLKSLHLPSNRNPRKALPLLCSNFDFYYEKFLVLMEYAL